LSHGLGDIASDAYQSIRAFDESLALFIASPVAFFWGNSRATIAPGITVAFFASHIGFVAKGANLAFFASVVCGLSLSLFASSHHDGDTHGFHTR